MKSFSKIWIVIILGVSVAIIGILVWQGWVFLMKRSEKIIEEQIKQVGEIIAEIDRINNRVIADMFQIRTVAEIIFSAEGSYSNVSCVHSFITPLCADIAEQVEEKPVIHSSPDAYCSYVKLLPEELLVSNYFCIDSQLTAEKFFVNPGEKNNCDGITFVCPKSEYKVPSIKTPEEEIRK